MPTQRPNVHLVLIGTKPGQKPPGRTVRCDQCEHWAGGRRASSGSMLDVGERCALLGGLHAADFGCAYFMRRPVR